MEKIKDPDLISGESKYIPLTRQQKDSMDEWVLKGVKKGYISGPFDLEYEFEFGTLYLAPLFVVPKPGESGVQLYIYPSGLSHICILLMSCYLII